MSDRAESNAEIAIRFGSWIHGSLSRAQ